MASDAEPLERDRRARRTARIERFEKRQRWVREWIKFDEIAEWCSEENSIEPNEHKRAWAFKKLAEDLLAGEFEENGHSRVHFLYLNTAKRVTPEWLRDVIKYNMDGHCGRFILAHCWFPRWLFDHWLARHRLQQSPPRFEPQAKQFASPVRFKKPKRGRPPEYDWAGVKSQLRDHVSQYGHVQTWDALLQLCSDFASELHPENKTPDASTIRAAIETHGLDAAAGMGRGK